MQRRTSTDDSDAENIVHWVLFRYRWKVVIDFFEERGSAFRRYAVVSRVKYVWPSAPRPQETCNAFAAPLVCRLVDVCVHWSSRNFQRLS